MTKAEAIKLIDERMCFGRGKWSEHHMPEIDDYWKAGEMAIKALERPERKNGRWILNRSGAYCCSECMEPCAGYVMMRPRDRFCKMCGADMRQREEQE